MFRTKISEAAAKAGSIAAQMRARYEAGDAEGGQKLALELTTANQEVERLRTCQRDYEAANALASRYIDPDPSTRPPAASAATQDREKIIRGAHVDAAIAYLRSGGEMAAAREVCRARGLSPQETATLIAADNRLGGILVPPEWLAAREGRQMPAVMRSLCDVVTTGSDSIVIPTVTGSLEANNMVAEGTERTTRQDVDFGGVEIKVNDWHPKPIVVSQKLLRNQGANIDSIIGTRIMRRLDLDEDSQFLNGTGVGEAYGLMHETTAHIHSQAAAAITWAGMINLVFDDVNGIGEEWTANGVMLMRRATYAAVLGPPMPRASTSSSSRRTRPPTRSLGCRSGSPQRCRPSRRTPTRSFTGTSAATRSSTAPAG